MGTAARCIQGPRGGRVSRARVLVALRVAAPPERILNAFTSETAEWWRPNKLFRLTDSVGGHLAFEPDPPQWLVEVGTRGTIEHSGWAAIPQEHAARRVVADTAPFARCPPDELTQLGRLTPVHFADRSRPAPAGEMLEDDSVGHDGEVALGQQKAQRGGACLTATTRRHSANHDPCFDCQTRVPPACHCAHQTGAGCRSRPSCCPTSSARVFRIMIATANNPNSGLANTSAIE